MTKIFIADRSDYYLFSIKQLLEKENKFEVQCGFNLSNESSDELNAEIILFEINDINIKIIKQNKYKNKILIGLYNYENISLIKETKKMNLSALASKLESYTTLINTLTLAMEGKVILSKNIYKELIK